jgi:hypothetical protein
LEGNTDSLIGGDIVADIRILVLEGGQFIGGTGGRGDGGWMGVIGVTSGEVTESELILFALADDLLRCRIWLVVLWWAAEFIAQQGALSRKEICLWIGGCWHVGEVVELWEV